MERILKVEYSNKCYFERGLVGKKKKLEEVMTWLQ